MCKIWGKRSIKLNVVKMCESIIKCAEQLLLMNGKRNVQLLSFKNRYFLLRSVGNRIELLRSFVRLKNEGKTDVKSPAIK